ncbi:stage V sporulation protein AE [Halalkalibacter nanhaiisediminis]|uniref:Stage V sporulation protein AE n=1 Tax=Halalkalibacter nanhaiisediminis TaxID=688079 RepID=A0A562QMR1_9BACI|nr:stage V sporulation protein AE [Halalkalibacter nanhaiisediminis]TWI58042.1 stage V sporulation protein AE [Halalkalibacter nanhaiisediminis]
MERRPKVIIVTDGDEAARKAVERAARDIGGRCITHSWGNPTRISGEVLVSLIMKTPYDPVMVMFDDCGLRDGPGEEAMRYVAKHPSIEVIGAIAVAAATHASEWTHVDISINRDGELTEYGVDKDGLQDLEIGRINGDTVYTLDELSIPIVVGIGDIGKMAGLDAVKRGAPITRKAIEIILERSGFHESRE